MPRAHFERVSRASHRGSSRPARRPQARHRWRASSRAATATCAHDAPTSQQRSHLRITTCRNAVTCAISSRVAMPLQVDWKQMDGGGFSLGMGPAKQ